MGNNTATLLHICKVTAQMKNRFLQKRKYENVVEMKYKPSMRILKISTLYTSQISQSPSSVSLVYPLKLGAGKRPTVQEQYKYIQYM